MRDYDKPKPPANTPPVIDPAVKPNSPADIKAEGGDKGEVSTDGTDNDDMKVEKALGKAQEGGSDGAGEAALDSLQPD
ncbi:hypothetical protein N6L26_00695 [Qipengyuania sp. SS22]|uniref:hypothetical protein n=1 Tax=Qipengyuania sp. SS22 TaxID=2979461 RepID=UPI0021E6074C|nr:hypothetical protein [Qipengyuania sp. SS22]UYH55122.1 hypothetical protein N6L26_00695 [Qipengyuania sp. SS22]